MRSAVALIILLLAAPTWAQPVRPGFQSGMAASILTASFAFLAPRTLEAVSFQQLALWGLRGITTLDAGLTIEERGATLDLRQADRTIFQRPLPPATAEAWGRAGADVMSAAWDASDVVRDAGLQGLITSFFEELFNHLDPYSRYIPPGAAEVDRARRSGEAGAGLVIVKSGAAVVVQSVRADGPGAEAGIVAGERVIAVDEQPVRNETLATVQRWLAGPEGTDVVITLRGRDGRIRTVDVERAFVPPETVFVQRTSDVLMIRITAFSRDTDQRLANELDRRLQPGPARPLRGMVIDLRGNRGGLLRQAIAATDLMLDQGLIATTAGRNPNATNSWRAKMQDVTGGLPIVVLVDGRSASAAEIMAAALADQGRAVIVGSSTLGKGLVQTIANLPDGGELFVTWSRVLAPLGWPIQGLGILPQVCTSQGQDATLQQLAALDRGTQRLGPALTRHRAARAPLPNAEIVELRTACPAAEGRD
ncbi:MAG: PDZ domain-containing protein, partial [Gemmatimonadaceae bacterium]|nr:PDZ domain-containing protein [Acetobacteraceae bacterium]